MTLLAVRLTNVEVAFHGGRYALSGVDARIVAGTVTGLVGESGSGKTTLCRVIAGLQSPTAGEVDVYGRSPVNLRGQAERRFRRSVQMLLQDARGSLSPRMTIRKLLDEPILIHRLDRAPATKRLDELLSHLGVGRAILDRLPYQLSDGQARRIALARALALEPDLLIADEPTAGLDLSTQAEVLNLLRGLNETRGMTLLICSHNLSVIARMATNLIVMYSGQIVEEGPTAKILHSPSHPYTAALLSASVGGVPALRPRRDAIAAALGGESLSGCRFCARCPRVEPRCRTEQPTWRWSRDTGVRCHFPLGG